MLRVLEGENLGGYVKEREPLEKKPNYMVRLCNRLHSLYKNNFVDLARLRLTSCETRSASTHRVDEKSVHRALCYLVDS